MSQNTNRKSGAERRHERDVRETREKKKLRLTAIIVVAVLAVLFCAAMLINSNYIRRHSVAISAGDLKFSPAEADFLFMNAYSEYSSWMYENMGESAQYYLPVSGTPLKSQVYDAETGQTWADFFHQRVTESVSQMAALCAEADKAGFVVPDEIREEMEYAIELMKESATMYGYESFEKYLQEVFSPSVDENSVRHVYEVSYKASAYAEHKRDSFTYSDEDLAGFYNENKDTYDLISFRYMIIDAETVDREAYESDEEYEEAKTTAQADAVARGQQIADSAKTEQDFIDAAHEYNETQYPDDDSTLRHYRGEQTSATMGEDRGAWLIDQERKPGDTAAIEATSGCYVLYFVSRESNDYNQVNLRQITITPTAVSYEDYPEGEEDPDFIAAVEQAKKDAAEEAEAVKAAYELGGSLEENFAELYDEYSSDKSVAGGLYENVYMYSTESVAPAVAVNAWAFEPGRKAGDYAVVIGSDGTAYFALLSSVGGNYATYLADNGIRDRDYAAWDESIEKPEVKRHWAFTLTSV